MVISKLNIDKNEYCQIKSQGFVFVPFLSFRSTFGQDVLNLTSHIGREVFGTIFQSLYR